MRVALDGGKARWPGTAARLSNGSGLVRQRGGTEARGQQQHDHPDAVHRDPPSPTRPIASVPQQHEPGNVGLNGPGSDQVIGVLSVAILRPQLQGSCRAPSSSTSMLER